MATARILFADLLDPPFFAWSASKTGKTEPASESDYLKRRGLDAGSTRGRREVDGAVSSPAALWSAPGQRYSNTSDRNKRSDAPSATGPASLFNWVPKRMKLYQ